MVGFKLDDTVLRVQVVSTKSTRSRPDKRDVCIVAIKTGEGSDTESLRLFNHDGEELKPKPFVGFGVNVVFFHVFSPVRKRHIHNMRGTAGTKSNTTPVTSARTCNRGYVGDIGSPSSCREGWPRASRSRRRPSFRRFDAAPVTHSHHGMISKSVS